MVACFPNTRSKRREAEMRCVICVQICVDRVGRSDGTQRAASVPVSVGLGKGDHSILSGSSNQAIAQANFIISRE